MFSKKNYLNVGVYVGCESINFLVLGLKELYHLKQTYLLVNNVTFPSLN